MVRYCLELPYSSVRHFPAGTYHEQMETRSGRAELEAMSIVQQAWYMFSHLSLNQWKESEKRFAKWMSAKPKPKPTNRANELIALLWGAPIWVLMLLGRRDD